MDKKVEILNIKMGKTATIKFKGSFKEHDLIYKETSKWLKNNNFKILGDYYFRFDPEQKDLTGNDILFELGIPVKNQNNDKDLVNVMEIPEREVISALYKGPYFNLPSVHWILEDYARKNNLAPMDYPTEIYLNDPLEVKSNELLTEVQYTVLEFKPENLPYVPLVNKIERKTLAKQKMGIIEHHGLVEDVYKFRGDLIKRVEKYNSNINETYFKYQFNPLGISPRGVVFEAGLPLNNNDSNIAKDDVMKIVEIPEHEVLSAVYKGPYINIPNVHRMIIDYAFENNIELIDYPEEIYLNSIFDVSPDDLLTEVRMQMKDSNSDKNIQLEREIERKTIKKHEVASIKCQGLEKINKSKVDLFKWIEKNNIKTSGDYFLKFHNHPRSLFPKNISYEIGIALDNSVENVIKVINYTKHKLLSTTHKGPISTLKDTHNFLKDYANENGFEPFDLPVNLFPDKTFEIDDDELLIIVRIPVNKV